MRVEDTAPSLGIEALGLGPLRLEDLVDREALREMASSFEKLFGIPIKILSSAGVLLADAGTQAPLCRLINENVKGKHACFKVVDDVRRTTPEGSEPVSHACFTGASYRIIPLEYDRRPIGRVVLGPYVPSDTTVPPTTLFEVDDKLERDRARSLFVGMKRADRKTVDRLSEHLKASLDLILFSGHKALLTSTMHLASVQESYRELQEKNSKLAEAYERLKELDRLKSNFLASVSHELRTPLTSIMGYSEMLAEGIAGPLNPEQAEFIQTIRTKSEQLLGLIMSLLDLSKLESGTMTVRKSELGIGSVLEEVVSTLAPHAAKKKITLGAEVPADIPTVYGDPDRLRQVFINLAENALKFTPEGGEVKLTARVVIEKPPDDAGLILVAPLRHALEVRVSDTGIGIPASERDRVFDAFYQVDQSSTREQGGAGLGLSIVKRLVEAHHGTIFIEANEPQGTVFGVTIPLGRVSITPPSQGSIPPLLAVR
jgi:signal transduction histidine kinase